jgi:hypothetical protein
LWNDLFSENTHISTVVTTHLDQCSKEAAKRIEFHLEVEREPSTRNTDYFKDCRRKFLSFYSGLLHEDSNNHFIKRVQGIVYKSAEFSRALDTIMSNLPKIGFRNINPLASDLAALQASETLMMRWCELTFKTCDSFQLLIFTGVK